MTFKEIAETTGFANPFHFSTAFKTVYGVSPRVYRTAISAGLHPAKLTPNRAVVTVLAAGSRRR